ncbi:MAG: hypothetical protein JXA20_08715 [Spirochaetes bacterium]|nr:hypothetical protein [Spirochaetota bacterium]
MRFAIADLRKIDPRETLLRGGEIHANDYRMEQTVDSVRQDIGEPYKIHRDTEIQ